MNPTIILPLLCFHHHEAKGKKKKTNFEFPPSAFWPSPTPITWEIERVDGKALSEDELANNGHGQFEEYDQDVLAKVFL